MSRRASLDLERALAGFDTAFERQLADVIIRAIADQSMVDNVMVIRTGESAAALVTALASILALSPSSARSRAAIRKTSEAFRKKLTANVRAAERSPDFYEFRRRTFHAGDRERGGTHDRPARLLDLLRSGLHRVLGTTG
jgi:hypothetical protein